MLPCCRTCFVNVITLAVRSYLPLQAWRGAPSSTVSISSPSARHAVPLEVEETGAYSWIMLLIVENFVHSMTEVEDEADT